MAEGGDPAAIVEREGLGAMEAATSSPASWRRRSPPTRTPRRRSARGNAKAMGPIVGFVMRETKGRADGGEVGRLIREQLGL